MSGEDEYDRLMALLDAGLAALKNDDYDGAGMALKAACDSADRLPKRPVVICLPDRSK